MQLTAIALVLCACAWMPATDAAHVKAKAKLFGRPATKHHKRGVLSPIPTFKLGHDIPLVTHSVVKPLVVTYPPTATVSAVKVPLAHPLLPRYPVGVGHRVPHLPHPHYGLKFPYHTKAVVLPKPDHHFHHHHHHVAPRPVEPIDPVPLPAIPQPVPVPSPPIIVPQPAPLPPPVHILPPNHLYLRPLPPTPLVPAAPAPVVAPAFSSFAPQFPYILRAGGAVQQSLFASYPRSPFSNYPTPLIPLSASAFSQIVPHQYLVSQTAPGDVLVEPHGTVSVEPMPAVVNAHAKLPQNGVHFDPHGIHLEAHSGAHLHPGQPEVHFHSSQLGVHQYPEHPKIHLQPAQPELHLQPGEQVPSQPELHLQPGVHIQGHPEVHLQQPGYTLQPQPEFSQPGHTEVQGGQGEIHFQGVHTDVNLQRQPEYHLQPRQPNYSLQPQPNFNLYPGQPNFNPASEPQPTQPTVDSDGWSPVPVHPTDVHNEHFPTESHHFTQDQGNQIFEQHSGGEQQYHEYQTQLQHHIHQLQAAQYEHHGAGSEYGDVRTAPPEAGHSLHFQHQPAPEYGPPGSVEGRSLEGQGEGDSLLYQNHIPLGLQPPLDRPLDHFR